MEEKEEEKVALNKPLDPISKTGASQESFCRNNNYGADAMELRDSAEVFNEPQVMIEPHDPNCCGVWFRAFLGVFWISVICMSPFTL
eukprot:gene2018-1999_t